MSDTGMQEMTAMLVEAADRTFSQASPDPGLRFDVPAWQAVEEAGIDRILLPEAQGGAGDAFEAAVQVTRRFGARACAVPFVESLVANRCLSQAGVEVAPGPKAIVLSVASEHVAWALDECLVVRPDGAVLPADARAFTGTMRSNLAGEPVRLLTAVWAKQCDADDHPGPLALYATLKAAAIVETLEAALDMTIRYVNKREQFGRRLSAFQAVQHMVACMAEEVAAAAAAVQKAGRALGRRHELYFAAIAKSRAGEAATEVAAMSHQCHGAMGYTWEYPLHRCTSRAPAWRDDAGSEQYWNERIGRAALASGAGDLWPLLLEGAPI